MKTLTERFFSLFLDRKSLSRGILTCVGTLIAIGFAAEHVKVLKNTTPSLPGRYFLSFPKIPPAKGDLTTYAHGRGLILMKQIVGVEGDRIFYDDRGNLWVGNLLIGKPYKVNGKGEVLHPLPSGVIPKDHVFLYAPHEESLDSRYLEVGLIYKKHLLGKVVRLWA